MAFCVKCGKELSLDAVFCSACGAPVQEAIKRDEARKTFYDGEIHKCPNCGEILKSFETNCPTCGYELRGAKATTSVKDFAEQLQEIEKHRTQEGWGDVLRQKLLRQKQVSVVDQQKISLINNFPIPNAKEDIIEFIILATSNKRLCSELLRKTTRGNTMAMTQLYDTWNMKLEQVFHKMALSFGDDVEYFKKVNMVLGKDDRKKLKKIIAKKDRRSFFNWGW